MPRTRLRSGQIVDVDVVTDEELAAQYKSTQVSDDFPLSVDSTDSSTRTVTVSAGGVFDWLQPGDIAEITGGAAAGDYTVESLTSDTEFVVEEAIVDTTSEGTLTAYHAVGADKVGVDNSAWQEVTGATVQESLDSADTKIAEKLTEQEHEDLDSLVHDLAEDCYKEYSFSGTKVTNVTAWVDSNKNTKIRETQITYSGNQVSQTVEIQYDGAGTEVQRLTTTYTYSGTKIVSSETTEVTS